MHEVFDARLSLEAFESDDDQQRKQRIQTLFEQVVDDVQLSHKGNEAADNANATDVNSAIDEKQNNAPVNTSPASEGNL